MAKKLDKKILEEPDALTLFFAHARVFIETNRKKIYFGSAILLGIFILAAGFYMYHTHYETKAIEFYNKTLNGNMASAEKGEEAVKNLKDLIAKYPRSNAATLGYYRLGSLYDRQNKTDEAISCYLEFVKRSSPESDLVTLAYSSLGALEEQKKNLKKALEYYEMAMKTKTASSFEGLNFQNMARIYEAMNDTGKAGEFYKKALSKTSDPIMTLMIKRKLSHL